MIPTNWHFAVELVNDETGERETVVVELSPEEQFRVVNNPRSAGCVINRYAGDRAREIVGEDFDCQAVAPVVLH